MPRTTIRVLFVLALALLVAAPVVGAQDGAAQQEEHGVRRVVLRDGAQAGSSPEAGRPGREGMRGRCDKHDAQPSCHRRATAAAVIRVRNGSRQARIKCRQSARRASPRRRAASSLVSFGYRGCPR